MPNQTFDIRLGDNLSLLPTLPDNSVDAIVCDPPYEIAFMQKKWDSNGVATGLDLWRECLRVLKPGGHLLAFGAARTVHRMACAIEDAGFYIKDQFMWVSGNWMTKGLSVSRAADREAGAVREKTTLKQGYKEDENGNVTGRKTGFDKVNLPGGWQQTQNTHETAPSTDFAKEWDGWHTQIKKVYEPIVCAQKPISEKTVVANIRRWGTGAFNNGACKVETKQPRENIVSVNKETERNCYGEGLNGSRQDGLTMEGRQPSTLIHSNEPDVLAAFPETVGSNGRPNLIGKKYKTENHNVNTYGEIEHRQVSSVLDDEGGSAARYFNACPFEPEDLELAQRLIYHGKITPSERSEGIKTARSFNGRPPEKINGHICVKPVGLMRHLVRLITPPNGTAIDPFMGSGSTGVAAHREGFNFIGFELDPTYFDIAKERMEFEASTPTLF